LKTVPHAASVSVLVNAVKTVEMEAAGAR